MFKIGDRVVWKNMLFAEIVSIIKTSTHGMGVYDISVDTSYMVKDVPESDLRYPTFAESGTEIKEKPPRKHGWITLKDVK